MAIGLRLNYWLATGVAECGTSFCAAGNWLRDRGGRWRQDAAQAMARPLLDVPPPPAHDAAPPLDAILLATWLWGEGNARPDQVEESLRLVRPFNLRPGTRLLHVGAGLGGVSVAIAKSTGCRVAAFECDPAVIAASEPWIRQSKRVTMALLDAGGPEPDGPRWDHAYVRFAAHDLPERTKFLARCKVAMMPGGHITAVDYACGPNVSRELAAWVARQRNHGEPWTVERWRSSFAQSGFDLRIEEDLSTQHRLHILSAWHRLLAEGRLAGLGRRQLAPLVSAAERWLREAVLIETGALRVMRFYAIMSEGSV
jgi:SAM-dependent methyltransferase